MMSLEDEEAVRKLLNAYHCIAERYPKSQRHKSAPDFRVTTPLNDFFFLCEVKSIENKKTSFSYIVESSIYLQQRFMKLWVNLCPSIQITLFLML